MFDFLQFSTMLLRWSKYWFLYYFKCFRVNQNVLTTSCVVIDLSGNIGLIRNQVFYNCICKKSTNRILLVPFTNEINFSFMFIVNRAIFVPYSFRLAFSNKIFTKNFVQYENTIQNTYTILYLTIFYIIILFMHLLNHCLLLIKLTERHYWPSFWKGQKQD